MILTGSNAAIGEVCPWRWGLSIYISDDESVFKHPVIDCIKTLRDQHRALLATTKLTKKTSSKGVIVKKSIYTKSGMEKSGDSQAIMLAVMS